jgi:zinc protease
MTTMPRATFLAALLVSSSLALAAGPAPKASPPVAAPALVRADAPVLPKPELETLPNGLTVAWYLSDHLPMIDLVLHVRAGDRDDPRGKPGVSGMVSAMLDRGAGGWDRARIANEVEKLGASRGASSGEDTSSVSVHGLAPDVDALIEVLARMAIRPEFPKDEFARQKARALDYWRHVGDSAPSLGGVVFALATSRGTPYGQSFSPRTFQRIQREDLVAFHQRHYTPANSVLVVVGRADRAKLRARIADLFGPWKGKAPARPVVRYSDPRVQPRPGQILIADRPGLTQAQVMIAMPAPQVKSQDKYPMAVANALLGEYFNSRLNSVLRDQLGLTYGISSQLRYSQYHSLFTVGAATANPTAGQLLKRAMAILEDVRDHGVTDEELTLSKEYLLGSFPLGVATLGSVAGRWTNGYLLDLGEEYLNGFIPKISAVTRAEVESSLRRYLRLGQAIVVVAGDGDALEASLKQAGYRSFKRIRLKDLD